MFDEAAPIFSRSAIILRIAFVRFSKASLKESSCQSNDMNERFTHFSQRTNSMSISGVSPL